MNAQTTPATRKPRTFKDNGQNRFSVPDTFPTQEQADAMRRFPGIFGDVLRNYESILICGAAGLSTQERALSWEGTEEAFLAKDGSGFTWQERLAVELENEANATQPKTSGKPTEGTIYPNTPELLTALRNIYKDAGPFEYVNREAYAALHKECCIARRWNVSPSVWASRVSPRGEWPTGLLALIAIRVYSMPVADLLKVYR